MCKLPDRKRAELVLCGQIWDGKDDLPRQGAVGIAGNRIVAVGDEAEVLACAREDAEIKRYEDGLIMPGFFDNHLHLKMGALSQEIINLHDAKNEAEAAQMVADYAAEHPEDEWVLGFSWYHIFWDEKVLPTRHSLDKLIPDRPVFLFNAEYHGAWVNSKALELCGVDKDTPNPPYGEIMRDADGEATGFLYETAMGLCQRAFNFTPERSQRILESFLKKCARLGVTGVSDMFPLPGMDMQELDMYRQFELAGKLTSRIFFLSQMNGDLDRAKALRRDYNTDMLRFSGLKQFVDGVSTTYTAYMVEPYADKPESRGDTLLPPEVLRQWILAADAEGFRVRLHSCGDGSCRLALDYYEEAAKVNGARNSRHCVEHCEIVHPEDVPRFAELGVIDAFQLEAIAITPDFADNPYPDRVGPEREDTVFRLRSMLDAGAKLSFGTDYPIVDLTPFPGIYRATTRLFDDGNPPGGWNPQEKITMAEALRGYTAGTAYMNFMEDELGTLQAGYLADIVVLDRNLFTVEPKAIFDTQVLLTISDGRIVHEV
jgi:hypothetical protein